MRGLALILMLTACAQEPEKPCLEWRLAPVPKHRTIGGLSVDWWEEELVCMRR